MGSDAHESRFKKTPVVVGQQSGHQERKADSMSLIVQELKVLGEALKPLLEANTSRGGAVRLEGFSVKLFANVTDESTESGKDVVKYQLALACGDDHIEPSLPDTPIMRALKNRLSNTKWSVRDVKQVTEKKRGKVHLEKGSSSSEPRPKKP
ncbi:unnamed protein product [Urochloa humidicola]